MADDPPILQNQALPTQTVVGLYDSMAHADAAIASLEAAGVPDTAISRDANARSPIASGPGAAVLDRSIAHGAVAVSVTAPATDLERVLDLLERHHPIDIDDRVSHV